MGFFDTDRWNEIWQTISRNRKRSIMTALGVFWGIFMLTVLLGAGMGLGRLFRAQLGDMSTNTLLIQPSQTSLPYKGMPKNRWWRMNNDDVENVRGLKEVQYASGVYWGGEIHCSYNERKGDYSLMGYMPDYQQINPQKIIYGRFINDVDMAQKRKVCVIGKQVYENLYPKGVDPCGTRIKIGPAYYQVIGVDYNEHSVISFGGRQTEAIVIPISVVQAVYNMGDKVQVMAVTAKEGIVMSDIIPKIRKAIASNHYIDPTDEQAVTVLNTEMFFMMIDSLFKGVNFLIWLIGIGTLLAGVIGVSNIMMVTVRERTTEIGIRRAIGATPKMILSQIIWESILLTAVAGMLGLLFSVLILQGLELAFTTDGILQAPFQISFWTAVGTLLGLTVLGVVAGLAPAARAMSIKPVDAMRDE